MGTVALAFLISFFASLMFAAVSRLFAVWSYQSRARRFIGKYRMLDQHTGASRGGTVTLAYDRWKNWRRPAPVMTHFC
jgi:hypothetical protein